ncbi:hypothetical protein EVG20_g2750 [Dentipellis fragilis]|uniref:DUF6534 domain-containing protein n=1 Tax=Dentipellis fragilis TaxID=205917 RepID=A0A4Y9Z703_9AGAM|nr:hypothetical protein EVG20_g2750 [Dentipellis fragilis]
MAPNLDTNIHGTLGVLFLGGTAAAALSGIVGLLTYLFFRLYPDDPYKIKAMVRLKTVLWKCYVAGSYYHKYRDATAGDLAMTYRLDSQAAGYRPHMLDLFLELAKPHTSLRRSTDGRFHPYHHGFDHSFHVSVKLHRALLAPPSNAAQIFMASFRVCLGINSTIRCILLKSWEEFIRKFTWSVTTAYSISACIDILISCSLCYFLRQQRGRTGIAAASQLLDTITVYTLNSGTLTCVVAIMSFISWFAFKGTLIFLGTHLLIGKLYTNAFLATLIMRRFLRERYSRTINTAIRGRALQSPRTFEFSVPLTPETDSDFVLTPPNSARLPPRGAKSGTGHPLEVKVDQFVHFDTVPYQYDPHSATFATDRAIANTIDLEGRSPL